MVVYRQWWYTTQFNHFGRRDGWTDGWTGGAPAPPLDPPRKAASRIRLRKKSKILKGRLPPEDGSDRRETLGKRVSDDFAKLIFRAKNVFGGRFFEKIENLKKPFTPEDGSDRRETLGKRVSDDFAKLIFRAEKTFGGAFFSKFSAD